MLVAAALSKREKATGRGLMLVKQGMVRKHAHLLPATQYAAMRSNVVLQPQASNGGKKRGADSGPKGLKVYGGKRQAMMAEVSHTIAAALCVPCGPS